MLSTTTTIILIIIQQRGLYKSRLQLQNIDSFFFLIDLRCRLVNACRISSTKTLNHRIILIFNVQSVNLHRLHPAHLDDTPRRSAPHRSHCALCMHNHPPLVGDTCLVLEDMGHQELAIPRHTVPVMKPSDASALLKMVI